MYLGIPELIFFILMMIYSCCLFLLLIYKNVIKNKEVKMKQRGLWYIEEDTLILLDEEFNIYKKINVRRYI